MTCQALYLGQRLNYFHTKMRGNIDTRCMYARVSMVGNPAKHWALIGFQKTNSRLGYKSPCTRVAVPGQDGPCTFFCLKSYVQTMLKSLADMSMVL